MSAVAIILLIQVSAVHADLVYDESVQGDLSTVRNNPTPIVVAPGSNVVRGATVDDPLDRDFFRITVSPSQSLDAIVFQTYQPLGGANQSFFGVQRGPEISNLNQTATLLGWGLFGNSFVGTNILDNLGQGSGAIGFTGSLPADTYTFWFQETGDIINRYEFDLQISSIPEPSSASLFLTSGIAMIASRRTRRGLLHASG